MSPGPARDRSLEEFVVRAVMATRCASARSSWLHRQLEAFFDIPDHFGLQQVALGSQQRGLAERKIEGAQHMEAFMGLAQVRSASSTIGRLRRSAPPPCG